MIRFRTVLAGVLIGVMGLFLSMSGVHAAEKTVTLSLGGQYCSYYPDDIRHALSKVPGVSSVHFNADKSKVIITGKKLSAENLVSAVNKVKGDGWNCEAAIAR